MFCCKKAARLAVVAATAAWVGRLAVALLQKAGTEAD